MKYPMLALLGLGVMLAVACAYVGSLLTPVAVARWTIQINDQDEARALLAMVGIRHLPLFLLAVLFGNIAFTWVRRFTLKAVVMAMLPYLGYVLFSAVADSLDAGENAWSWLAYEPAYFIWPHFVAVPVGLLAAGRMVRRRSWKPKTA
jgi:undecaprenyl pyrophosphate phosphatase UppP